MAIEITDGNFSKIINSNKVVLVDFYANWCGPCKAISPMIEQLAQQYNGRAIIGKLDVDKNPNVPAIFGIKNIPAILFFKNGELVDRQMGSGQKSLFEQKINALI